MTQLDISLNLSALKRLLTFRLMINISGIGNRAASEPSLEQGDIVSTHAGKGLPAFTRD